MWLFPQPVQPCRKRIDKFLEINQRDKVALKPCPFSKSCHHEQSRKSVLSLSQGTVGPSLDVVGVPLRNPEEAGGVRLTIP
jgi:hypothetical protein